MTEPRDRHSEHYGWYVVFVLCVCGVVANIDRQIINLLVEYIKDDLDVSDTRISLLQGFAFAAFYATVAIPLGRLADSYNRRWLITLGIFFWTLAAIACGLANTFGQLFVARMFVGIGEAVLTPAGFSLIADLFRARRLARPISVFTASSFLGSGIALMVGGLIVNQLNQLDAVILPLVGQVRVWQGAFILGALPGLVVAFWFFYSVREPVRRAAASIDDYEYRQGFVHALRFCVRNKRLILSVFIGLSLIAAAQFSLGAWVPAFFIRVHGWAAGDIGYLQGMLFAVCGTLGVVAGGWITDQLQRRGYSDANMRVITFSTLLALPCAVLFPLLDQANLAAVSLVPLTFFGTIPFGAGPAVIPMISPVFFRAQLVALYLLVANLLGQAGGPFLVALITDQLFGAELEVGRSLLISVPLLLTGGAALSLLGWRPMRKLVVATA